MIGIVRWFNNPKGYGEICTQTGEVFFFTYLELPKIQKFRTIERGKIVEFLVSNEIQFGQRVAKKIKLVKAVTKKIAPLVDELRNAISL